MSSPRPVVFIGWFGCVVGGVYECWILNPYHVIRFAGVLFCSVGCLHSFDNVLWNTDTLKLKSSLSVFFFILLTVLLFFVAKNPLLTQCYEDVSLGLPFSFLSFFAFLGMLFRRVACGSSQARGWIGATAASLWHRATQDLSHVCNLYARAHGNAQSLTHWARPGIEPMSSWILVHDGNCHLNLLIHYPYLCPPHLPLHSGNQDPISESVCWIRLFF